MRPGPGIVAIIAALHAAAPKPPRFAVAFQDSPDITGRNFTLVGPGLGGLGLSYNGARDLANSYQEYFQDACDECWSQGFAAGQASAPRWDPSDVNHDGRVDSNDFFEWIRLNTGAP